MDPKEQNRTRKKTVHLMHVFPKKSLPTFCRYFAIVFPARCRVSRSVTSSGAELYSMYSLCIVYVHLLRTSPNQSEPVRTSPNLPKPTKTYQNLPKPTRRPWYNTPFDFLLFCTEESAALRIGSAGRFARPLPVVIPHKGGSASDTPPDETPAANFSPPLSWHTSIHNEEPLHLFMKGGEPRPRLSYHNIFRPMV